MTAPDNFLKRNQRLRFGGEIFCWRNVVLMLSLLIMFLGTLCADSPSKRVLLITGGHDFEHTPFIEMFDSFAGIEFDEAVQPQANDVYGATSAQYDALVFYDMVQDISDAQKQAFVDMLQQGKGVVFLHHSLVSYQEWEEFEDIIGGRYYLESEADSLRPASTYRHDVNIPVKIVDRMHPITQSLDDFEILDEVYGGFNVLPSVHPLLSTSHPESGKIIGWTNEYGRSRVVYLQLGHGPSAYQNPNYQSLVRRSIEWVMN